MANKELIRRNIEINSVRADREYAKEHHLTDAPQEIKSLHRKLFENAEYERERKENIKRGVK